VPPAAHEDLYDDDDLDPSDTGDDRNRLVGRHSETNCRLHRDERYRREAAYTALGCGREYRHLMEAGRRRVLPPTERSALPARRQLPAPEDEDPTNPHSPEEDVQ
jgi:hypothetical protein